MEDLAAREGEPVSPADIHRWAYSELVQCKPQYSERLNALADVVEAQKAMVDDIADRFDLDSPSTNPGIKVTVAESRAALARVEALQP